MGRKPGLRSKTRQLNLFRDQEVLGIAHDQKPVSVMLPPEIDALVRSLPNRSGWLRAAIVEKLQRDGLLGDR